MTVYELIQKLSQYNADTEVKFHCEAEYNTDVEAEIDKSNDVMKCFVDNADRLSREADTEGITGFMYGCAVSILSQCWEYGEYLRKWHNKKYDYDGDGAVNPAVITVR